MNNWKNTHVRLVKVGTKENASYDSPVWEGFKAGNSDKPGVPISYWVEGVLITPVESGSSLIIERHTRNGVHAFGHMQTSMILSVASVGNDSLRVETINSVYILSKTPAQEYSTSGESKTDGTSETK